MKLKWRTEWETAQWNQLDRIAIGLIDQLCKTAPAKVVISSTWRLGSPHSTFEWRFKEMGFKNIEVVGKTPVLNVKRGYEIADFIADWLRAGRPLNKFVIFDDDSDMLETQAENFVHVRNNNGLQLEHYRQALRILAPDHPSLTQFE